MMSGKLESPTKIWQVSGIELVTRLSKPCWLTKETLWISHDIIIEKLKTMCGLNTFESLSACTKVWYFWSQDPRTQFVPGGKSDIKIGEVRYQNRGSLISKFCLNSGKIGMGWIQTSNYSKILQSIAKFCKWWPSTAKFCKWWPSIAKYSQVHIAKYGKV